MGKFWKTKWSIFFLDTWNLNFVTIIKKIMKNSKPHRDELKSKLPDMLSMIVSVWIFFNIFGIIY